MTVPTTRRRQVRGWLTAALAATALTAPLAACNRADDPSMTPRLPAVSKPRL